VRRRQFIALLFGALWARAFAAHGQQPNVPTIGYLATVSLKEMANLQAAFHRGLAANGYVEGRNLTVVYRSADGHYDRLPALAADLVDRRVTVILAASTPAAVAAKAATATIPIVFSAGADPVALGLVSTLARPGGNITGLTHLSANLEAKRLGLLREMVPKATTIGILLNPDSPTTGSQLSGLQIAAPTIGLHLHVLRVRADGDIDAAFELLARERIPALLVAGDPFFFQRHSKLVNLAAHHAVPAMYAHRDHSVVGGLMSYGIDLADVYRQCGVYVARILEGEKPNELPVLEPTKFELVVNLKTAKALGLTVPPTLLAHADEVIE
jgi:putative tryptophan/tyrosine transport system substrate-binding protein